MKTFKWTVPEFGRSRVEKLPRKKREKGSANDELRTWPLPFALGIFWLLLALISFDSSRSITGLKTYFWEEGTGKIVSAKVNEGDRTSNIRMQIQCSFPGTGDALHDFYVWRHTPKIQREERMKKWKAKFAAGEEGPVFINQTGQISFRRWRPWEFLAISNHTCFLACFSYFRA